jgi:hypothetical protein
VEAGELSAGRLTAHALSCTSTRICTALGGFEYVTGTPDAGNEQVRYASIVERWSGSTWSLGS